MYPIIHPATNAFRTCSLPHCLCSPKSTGKYPRTLEGPNSLIHITGLFTANFSSMIPPVSPRYLMFDFPLNFTAGVRMFPILLTECPESPWTITHHFCYQNMKTSTNLLLNPITLAYLLPPPPPPPFGQFSFQPFFVSKVLKVNVTVVHVFLVAHPGTLVSGGRPGLTGGLGQPGSEKKAGE